jgi:hypothetical protein
VGTRGLLGKYWEEAGAVTWLGWYSHEYGAVTAAGFSFLAGVGSVTAAFLNFRLSRRVSRTQILVQQRLIRKDLFNLRFQVYSDLEALMTEAIQLRPSSDQRVMVRFRRLRERSYFLFQEEVVDYMKQVGVVLRQLLDLYWQGKQEMEGSQVVYEATVEVVDARDALFRMVEKRDLHFSKYLKIADDFASSMPSEEL